MYKISENFYINPKYISTIYKNKQDGTWRLVMLGATDADEFILTEEEFEKVLEVSSNLEKAIDKAD